jgi:flagellar basal-body rod protein FlgF
MDAAGYATLTRQSGLMREMGVVANNIANASTTGFRREGVVFSEYVTALDQDPSLSMAYASGRDVDLSQAGLARPGAALTLPSRARVSS